MMEATPARVIFVPPIILLFGEGELSSIEIIDSIAVRRPKIRTKRKNISVVYRVKSELDWGKSHKTTNLYADFDISLILSTVIKGKNQIYLAQGFEAVWPGLTILA